MVENGGWRIMTTIKKISDTELEITKQRVRIVSKEELLVEKERIDNLLAEFEK